MFFGHSFDTIGSKSAISASTHALGYMPLSLRREQYGLVTVSYSIELEGSQKSLLSRAVLPNKPVKLAVTCGVPKIASLFFRSAK
jgi:hypothetical protein